MNRLAATKSKKFEVEGDFKIAITGSNGYVGKHLIEHLKGFGYNPFGVERKLLYGDVVDLQRVLSNCDAVINLAGAPISQRWTKKSKRKIFDSRIQSTRNLIAAINGLSPKERPKHFLSVSAIGLYENGTKHNEMSTRYDDGFLGYLVRSWENEMIELDRGVKYTVFRLGLVLGKKSKVVKRMLPVFRSGFGGPIGDGLQAFPFVHIDDVVRAFEWAIRDDKTGIFNLTSPQKVINRDFTKAFAKVVRRPAFFTIKKPILDLVYGKASIMVLKSPIVKSLKIREAGFRFSVYDIEEALRKSIK